MAEYLNVKVIFATLRQCALHLA